MMETEQLNPEKDDLTSDPEMDRLLQAKKPASSGTAIAILALLVAMAAVSATGWQWWQTRFVDQDETTQKDAITQLQNRQQQLARSVELFESQLGSVKPPINA